MTALSPGTVSSLFLDACKAELSALKPGNVHVHAPGHGMEISHFEAAAEAAAPVIALPGLSLGMRIQMAVSNSMEAAQCNTNLGIILLCAPLAAAALRPEHLALRERLKLVLAELTPRDAGYVYAAIRRANPGGLGKSDEADVADSPTIPLLEAMEIAAPRDRIAANYVSGFADIFDDHVPLLMRIRQDTDPAPCPDDAVATLYMSLLARFPDSHIRRKFGMETAAHVQRLAQAARSSWSPNVMPQNHGDLLALDRLLKSEGWNPGTTADFVVATVLAAEIERLDHH